MKMKSIEIINLLKDPDELFYLYQDFSHLKKHIEDYKVLEEYCKPILCKDYRKTSNLHLIDKKDLIEPVCEIRCNIGQSYSKLKELYSEVMVMSVDTSKTAYDITILIANELLQCRLVICKSIIDLNIGMNTYIWEDPHSASDEEYTNIINHIKSLGNVIYFPRL